jgi:hypothetical protein
MDASPDRYSLNTSHLWPAWMAGSFLAVWIPFGIFLTAFFVVDAGPSLALFPLLITAAGAWHSYSLYRGYRNPDASFVALGELALHVRLYEPWRAYSATISYDLIDQAYESSRHPLVTSLSTWPFRPAGNHVDITLRRPMWLLSRYSGLSPRTTVVHLDVANPAYFLEALRAKLCS